MRREQGLALAPEQHVFSLAFRTDARLVVVLLAVAMLLAAAGGARLGRSRARAGEIDAAMVTSVFGLLGLLLAFTFSMAGARYDGQRKLIAEEANAIGTAALRSDLFPDVERVGFRAEFRDYLEARIDDQQAGADVPRITAARDRSFAAQKRLWARASRMSQDPKLFVANNQMIMALNQMFDAAGRRYAAEIARVPDVIIDLLFGLCIAATFLYAYEATRAQKFEWLTAVAFVVVAALTVYVTLDLDRPRRGMIDVTDSGRSLVNVRSLFD